MLMYCILSVSNKDQPNYITPDVWPLRPRTTNSKLRFFLRNFFIIIRRPKRLKIKRFYALADGLGTHSLF